MRVRFCLVLFWGVFFAQSVHAQHIVFRGSVTHASVAPRAGSMMGRDFWFVPQNGSGSHILLLASERPTTAFIQRMGQPIQRVAIGSWECVKWEIPYLWYINSSDQIERTAIHVWCDSVDLSLSLVVQSEYNETSDMLSIPPAPAWDSSFIIVPPGGGYTQQGYTSGSEFTIVSNADSTQVWVSPTTGIVSNYSTLAHKAGQPFSLTLNRGQVVQYVAVQDSLLTGTQVRSNKPVLVVASSSYGIPCDVMRGMHEWGTRYYSTPYPKSTYKIVASAAQTIFRNGAPFCTLQKAGTIYTTTSIKDSGSVWTSDMPFAIVQFPFGGAEVQLQAVNDYPKSSIFSVFTAWNASTDINLFISTKAKNAAIDGRDIRSSATRVWRDSVRECYRFSLGSSYAASRHLVESDSSVGIYTVCAGTASSLYAFGTGCGPTHAIMTDTIPPFVETSQEGKCLTIVVRDDASQLSGIVPDTAFNFDIMSDAAFYSESGVTTISCCIADTLRPSSYSFTAFDGAGNATHYSVSYVPDPRMTHPGISAVADKIDSCLVLYWTDFNVNVVDTSFVLMTVDNVWTDDPAFTFAAFSSLDNTLPFNLLPDSSHILHFQFRPSQTGTRHAHAFIHTRPNATTVSVPLTAVSLPWDDAGVQTESITENTEPVVKVTNGRLIVRTPAAGSFELFDLLGQQLIEKNVSPTAIWVDISSFPSGLCLYRIESRSRVYSGELIIEK